MKNRKRSAAYHGMVGTSEYGSWKGIKSRCYNPNACTYEYYGGRGITVCDEWKNSFRKFIEDMGRKPDSTYTIDRIDNSLGYCKSNCRWATKTEQVTNRRAIKSSRGLPVGVGLITIKNRKNKRAEGAKQFQVSISVKYKRIYIGSYHTKEEAYLAYKKAFKEIHGKEPVDNGHESIT